ncbi:MAG: stage V sporulation protein B [Acetivibrionales bacterium]
MSGKSFISGAIILMAAGLVVRVFGFIYRIYLSNLIGAEGIGLFQLISPIYSLVILTLTSGISIAVSKMVAEEYARNNLINLVRITKYALLVVLAAGTSISVLMYFKMDFITSVIIKDSRTYYAFMFLLPCIPVIAAASVFKGYYYGIQDAVPPALSMITEQVVRIGLVMLTAQYFLRLGLEYACAVATAGMAIGEMSNLCVLLVIYRIRKKKGLKGTPQKGYMRKRKIIGELLKISLPVSSNRFITSVMSAAENIMIPRMLVLGGMSYQHSIELYGKLTGMAMPLLFFPGLVTSSLATTLVPAISEAMSLRNFRSVNHRVSKSIQITFILGFIFMAVFMVYPNKISNIIYKKENIGDILHLLSFTCIFIYLQQILTGTLNGLGKQGISLRNSILGYAIRILFVLFCIPAYGIEGYVWGIVISFACVSVLNLVTVTRLTGMAIDFRNWIIKPGAIGVVMLFISKYINSFFGIFKLDGILAEIIPIGGNIIIAVCFMFVIRVIDKDEILKLIGFKKIRKI